MTVTIPRSMRTNPTSANGKRSATLADRIRYRVTSARPPVHDDELGEEEQECGGDARDDAQEGSDDHGQVGQEGGQEGLAEVREGHEVRESDAPSRGDRQTDMRQSDHGEQRCDDCDGSSPGETVAVLHSVELVVAVHPDPAQDHPDGETD